jgi:hypothetical protein
VIVKPQDEPSIPGEEPDSGSGSTTPDTSTSPSTTTPPPSTGSP